MVDASGGGGGAGWVVHVAGDILVDLGQCFVVRKLQQLLAQKIDSLCQFFAHVVDEVPKHSSSADQSIRLPRIRRRRRRRHPRRRCRRRHRRRHRNLRLIRVLLHPTCVHLIHLQVFKRWWCFYVPLLETKSQDCVPAPYLVDCIFRIEFFGDSIFVSLVIVFQFARRLYRSLCVQCLGWLSWIWRRQSDQTFERPEILRCCRARWFAATFCILASVARRMTG